MTGQWLRHLAEHIDPVALTIGTFSVRWYSLCFLTGFFLAVLSLLSRSKKNDAPFPSRLVNDAALLLFAGVLIGGRIGYAALYEPSLFLHPVSLVWPIDPSTGTFTGIRGMSFFGALVGGAFSTMAFSRFRRISFLSFSDFLAPAVPIALFFGRIGNFLNLELPGRRTSFPLSVNLPDPGGTAWEPRHPSQLYEALLEGVVLFAVLEFLRRRSRRSGTISFVFLSGYASLRFFVEFLREPDPGVPMFFGWMTMGQALSAVLLSAVVLSWRMGKWSGKEM